VKKIRPVSFCGLLIIVLLGLDNSVVSFNSSSTAYLEEELNLLWEEHDPAGKDIFLTRVVQRLPEWEELFKEAAVQTDQHWTLLAAISYQESHWNPKAISKTGVRGLMMLTQTTAKEVGISKRTDPKQSVKGGSIYFQNLLEKFPDSTSEIHYFVATLEVGRNKNIEAIAAYKKSIETFDRTQKIVPDYLREAHYKLANLLYQEGQYPESIESFNTAIKLFPDHPHRSWSEFISADALKKIKNNQKATAQLNQLIKSQPKNDLIKKAAQSQLKIMEWEKENANAL